MSIKDTNIFDPLPEPIPITEQEWPENTVPILHTKTWAFNHEKYIKDCIEGILKQKTTFPVQVLLHDDASTDNTGSILLEYRDKYPKLIKVFCQKENSFSNKNREVLRAEFNSWRIGKYEAVCEGDDYWTDPLKLQKQVNVLENHPEYSMCFHNAYVIYENNDKKSHVFTKIYKNEYCIDDVIQNDWFIPTQSIVYRTNFYKHPKWTRYVFGGDLAMQLMLATKGKIGAVNETMAIYRKHKTSLSHNRKVGFHQLKIIETLSFFNIYTEFQYNDIIQRKILSIRENLYNSYLAKLPFWNKIVNPDYIKFRLNRIRQKKA